MPVSKIPLIYILSNSASGSTLLELLLGSHANIWTTGETHVLFEWFQKERLCGCGVGLSECGFWQAVLSELKSDYAGAGDPLQLPPASKFKRWGHLVSGLNGRSLAPAIEEYGRANHELFSVIKKVVEERGGARVQWMVDASKSPFRLQWLHESGYFNVRVIHIMKDPRAFVHSMLKSYATAKKDSADHSVSAARFARKWLAQNVLYLFQSRLRISRQRVFRLRYEQLAWDTNATIGRLFDWLQVEPQRDVRQFRQAENHAVGGNRMRWQNQGIYLDDEWRQKLRWQDQRMAWMLTWPLASWFGYRQGGFNGPLKSPKNESRSHIRND